MTDREPTAKEIREYVFGWLWIEENVMQPVRKQMAEYKHKNKVKP
jgi:hypothetical protein